MIERKIDMNDGSVFNAFLCHDHSHDNIVQICQ